MSSVAGEDEDVAEEHALNVRPIAIDIAQATTRKRRIPTLCRFP